MKKNVLVFCAFLLMAYSPLGVVDAMAKTVVMGGQYQDSDYEAAPTSRMPLPYTYISQEGHVIEACVDISGALVEVLQDDIVLYTTIIEDDRTLEIPLNILGQVKLKISINNLVYSAFIEL